MRADATFIAIEVDAAAAADPRIAAKLTEACPVDIYAQEQDGSLRIVEQNLDECVLCRLCIDATDSGPDATDSDPDVTDSDPARPVKVIKLYDAEALLA
jgi:NAD-dependent dihydropyrimidine dehydrogenase PreA subunit